MNWRVGLKRIAIILACAYWALAAVVIWFVFSSTYLDKHRTPFGPRASVYTIEWPTGGVATVRAQSRAEALRLAEAYTYAPSNGSAYSPWDQQATHGEAAARMGGYLAGWLTGFAVLFAAYKAARWVALGFARAPAA